MLAGVNCLAGDLILGLFKRSSDFSGRRICEETTKNNNKKMAYEVTMVYHLHMPCILWEHLPNIPNECPKREVQDYLVHLFFVFDSTVIG